MFGRKKKRKEPLPWYRARNYKGTLTETEKRELDSFRHRESEGGGHPSASYDDLPEEAQSYSARLRLSVTT
jgi:exonuclease I